MTKNDVMYEIILLGNEGVGKTTFLEKYSAKQISKELIEKPEKNQYIKAIEISNQKFTLVITKMEEYQFSFQSFRNTLGARGAILMYDITNSLTFDHISYRTQTVRGHFGDIPIILVGSKADLLNKREVSSKEAKSLSNTLGFSGYIEFSSKTGKNIDKVFELITKAIIEGKSTDLEEIPHKEFYCPECGRVVIFGQKFCPYCGNKIKKNYSFLWNIITADQLEVRSKALEKNPNDAHTHFRLGNTLLNTRRFGEAIKEYKKAVRLDPDHAGAHTRLGLALTSMGQFDEAINEFKNALRIRPNFSKIHNYLGHALFYTGQLDEAIKEFKEALRIKSKVPEFHKNLGMCLEAKGLFDDAIKEYQEALYLNPDYVEVHYHIGIALSKNGQFDEAIKEYREALINNQKDAKVRTMLALTLYDQGQIDEAIDELKIALKDSPLRKIDSDFLPDLVNIFLAENVDIGIVSGGDGSSKSKAILISECNNTEGIIQEYIELGKRFGQYKKISRRLIKDKNNFYDLYELDIKGKKIEVYFDVTDFIGK